MPQPYPTDLTDDQWHRVSRVLAAAGAADPDALRPVVDGILFRDAACAVWWLTPTGYPPAGVLRDHFERWAKDGTWEAVLAARQRPGGSARLPVMRQWSDLSKRVRFGAAVRVPARLGLQAAQAVGRLFSPWHRRVRRFERRVRRSYKLLFPPAAEAVGVLTAALAELPDHPFPLVHRARAYFAQKRYAEAEADAWRAVGSPLALPYLRAEAHHLLAACTALTGQDLGRAAEHQTEARWALDRDARGFREGAGPVTRVDALMAAHDELAEYLINFHMNFDAALGLYRRKPAARAAAAAPDPIPADPGRDLYLPDDWVRNVGHTAYLDTFAKMKQLGWGEWDRMVLLAPPGATANRHYAGYWAGHYEVVTDARRVEALTPTARGHGHRVAGLIRLPGGVERYFCEGLGAVQEAWEAAGRGPLLALTDDDRAFGRGVLRKLGLPDGAWFVCVHVREPGYHGEAGNTHQSHRNADIRDYLPAFREVVRRGGWVIRMGDKSMSPAPAYPGVVDYARSKLKSERMDVFLCGAARFFVGVASGLCHVPTSFGVPCVLTNWVSNALPVYSKHDLFLPKLLRAAGGRTLPFDEMFGTAARLAAYSGIFLHDHDLTAVDNAADELREVVAEMLDQLDGRAAYTPADLDRQARLARLLRGHGLLGFPRVGRDFLRRHAGLLPAAPVIPAAA